MVTVQSTFVVCKLQHADLFLFTTLNFVSQVTYVLYVIRYMCVVLLLYIVKLRIFRCRCIL